MLNSLGHVFLSNNKSDYQNSLDAIFAGMPELKYIDKFIKQMGHLHSLLMQIYISSEFRLIVMHIFSKIQEALIAGFIQLSQVSTRGLASTDLLDEKNEIDSLNELKRKFQENMQNISSISTTSGVLFGKENATEVHVESSQELADETSNEDYSEGHKKSRIT